MMRREDHFWAALCVGFLWALATVTLVGVAATIIEHRYHQHQLAFLTDSSGDDCCRKGDRPSLLGYLLLISPIGIVAGFAGFMWRYKQPD
jgi:hypothetical protein